MSGSVTTDKQTLSHLQPANLQIFDDASPFMSYRFLVGLADLNGALIYNTMAARMGDMRRLNDNGFLVFPLVMADMRGGLLTLVSTMFNEAGSIADISKRHTCRYGRITNQHTAFQATVIRSADTDTETSSSDKTTIGGNAGVSYGIGSAGISGSREHQGPGGPRASSYAGRIRDVTVVWIAK